MLKVKLILTLFIAWLTFLVYNATKVGNKAIELKQDRYAELCKIDPSICSNN